MRRFLHGIVTTMAILKLGSNCQKLQQSNLRKLLSEFVDLLQDKAGRTTTVEHTIDTGTAYPVCLPLYKVTHAYRDIVESELKIC